MFSVVLELTFIELVFNLRPQLAKTTLLTVGPISFVPVANVPHILTCAMPLICHPVSLIVTIHKDYPAKAVLSALMPVAFVDRVALWRDAVAKPIAFASLFTPLALVPIAIGKLLHSHEFSAVEL